MRSQTKLLLGGDVRVRLPGHYTAGITAWAATSAVAVPGGSTGVDYQMDFGYGGVVTERSLLRQRDIDIGARLTFGAGSAHVSLPGATGYSAADNFGIAIAETVASKRLAGPVALRAQLGYRAAFGVEDIPHTIASHFRGPELTVGMVFGPW